MVDAWIDFIQAGREGSTTVLIVLVASAIILLLSPIVSRRTRDAGKFPTGPPGWPILGHLPLIKRAAHQVLADLSQKQGYGPIMGLRLGCQPAVVVSSAELAKEVLLTHDKIFANRPRYRIADDLFFGYNNSVILSSYTPHLAWLRKVYTLELFTAKRLQQLQYIRQDEVRRLLRAVQQASSGGREAVDVGKHVAEMSANATARMLHSATLADAAPDLPDLIRGLEITAVPTLGDFIPWLRFLDFLQVRRMRRTRHRFGQIIDSMLSKRRQAMATTPSHELPHDFLQVILLKEVVEDPQERLTYQEMKSIISDIIQAGIHTVTATTEWAMAELLRSARCMQELRKEVDEVMGDRPDELVTDEDVGKMPYLEKTVKEVLRLHPSLPMLVPRISSEECKLGGYTLPKGTHAFVNVWAIARDPVVWEKPQEFRPERFEGRDLDLRGQHYELLPFGSGRRICPGMRLGLSIVQVTVANLVRTFDWDHATTLDMSEKAMGIANSKSTPLLAIPKARHALSLHL